MDENWFTLEELTTAAARANKPHSWSRIETRLKSAVTAEAVRDAAREAGASADKIIYEARRHRERVIIANDDDVLTVGELKMWLMSGGGDSILIRREDASADKIMKYITDHREPEYIPGKVYRDASGTYYARTEYGAWLRFGLSSSQADNIPVRPLQEMP
mgnify:CR=1 FL=1